MMHRPPTLRDALRSIALIGGACVVVSFAQEGFAQAPPPAPTVAPTIVPPPPPPLSTVMPQQQPPGQQPPGQQPPGQQPPAQQPLMQTAPTQPSNVAPAPQEEYEEEEPRSRRARRRTREPRPPRLDWKPGEAIPTGYEARSGPSKRLLISGLVTAGSVYVGSSIAAYIGVFAGTTELAPLFAPVIGPFITIETADADGAAAYLLVLNGLTQTAGVTLAIFSGFFEDTWLARLPTGLPLDDGASAPRIRANAGFGGGSFGIDF